MKVSVTVKELHEAISAAGEVPVGFVPTMGALHRGHLSLVMKALDESPLVVVSIFVNPTQFNDTKDLEKYPRTPAGDLAMLREILRPSDIVFMPGEKEIYPEKDTRTFSFGNLDRVMEALHRPGHFNGVAQVVSRLFEIVGPSVAYFGQKDFQQLAVIRELVRQTGSAIKIVACPIVRESDGLAMSSRNVLLEPGIRKNASSIFRALSEASTMLSRCDIPEIRQYVAG
ncbi:MAG: pantoate--beta-alanine ligase, partial [Bacteroidales bacterium]|nr:pantoate--beta-alanine ligase [Bacteroidales bacterium]